MIRGETLTAIIPVRGGSKGIPGKNMYRLGGGDGLLERTIKLALKNPLIDRVLVSTDDAEMYALAERYQVAAPAMRPAHLASDHAKTIDVVADLVDTAGIDGGYILLLQVTSPLRTSNDLASVCRLFEDADPAVQAVVSLVAHDAPHPDKLQKITDGYVSSYTGSDSHVARQLLPAVYAPNGAFYLTHRDVLLAERTFIPARTIPYIMAEERSLNLDGPYDLVLLEALVARGLVAIETL